MERSARPAGIRPATLILRINVPTIMYIAIKIKNLCERDEQLQIDLSMVTIAHNQ